MSYAEVLVDVANRRLDRSYHYFIPEKFKVLKGMRVLVPLQQRQVQGLVITVADQLPKEVSQANLRPIIGILDSEYAVPPDLIDLALWLADTTICSIAQSLHTVWPLLNGKVEEWAVPLVSVQEADVQTLKWLDPEAYKAIEVLGRARRGGLNIQTLLKRANISREILERLIDQGLIKKDFRFASGLAVNVSTPVINVSTSEDKVFRGYGQEDLGVPEEVRQLNSEQSNAAGQVIKALQGRAFETLLLHGITGSGKTEVYRECISQLLALGGDAILLVPEISLTSQIANYLQKFFNNQVCVLHSGLTPKEKRKAWEDILKGKKRLVIGARSAVFAPLPNLQLIILDEEHDGAYKQDENPKYHAREVARKRMEQRGGVVLLGSATPSLEAYAAAQTGKIKFLTMSRRFGQSMLPVVEIVDMRQELAKGNRSIFSLALQYKLRERISKGEQAMLFLNRRGYSTFVVCRECGYVVRCPHCDVSLTYHSQGQKMRCHYCDYQTIPPHSCPHCGSRYIRFFGQGTQRVEEDIKGLLPYVSVLRMDGDTTRLKEAHQDILDRFSRQEASILVGTQMMAKGLDFPNVTLVGVIAADQTLNMPDFRARERTFQLLTQVAGRAGRSVKAGEVVIQTYAPTDRAIIRAAQHDFPGFFWEEIRYRKERAYPPFTHVIRAIIMHEKEERVIRAANDLVGYLRLGMTKIKKGNNELDILGPAPAILPRLKNNFRWQVAVKGKKLDDLRTFLRQGMRDFYQSASSNGINVSIEVDPLGI